MNVRHVQSVAGSLRESVERVIVGKRDVIDLLLIALLSEGHVLLEDVPGIGKTTLAKSLARSLGCSFHRIQCTPDLLPSDVLGRKATSSLETPSRVAARSRARSWVASCRWRPGRPSLLSWA